MMGASSKNAEYLTALASRCEQATDSSLPFVTALEERIERSKSHWSEMVELNSNLSEEEAAAEIVNDNKEVFKTLQMHPTWGEFFWTFGYETETHYNSGELVVGEKFAEGGQAELFRAQIKWSNSKLNDRDLKNGVEWVLKVFKKGTLLRHLQQQWPHGLFQYHAEMMERTKLRKPLGFRYHCRVYCATLLENGRFAFLMQREHNDVRTLIEEKTLERGYGCAPFSTDFAQDMMYFIARGMAWLHDHNIVHRDLKASNVLYFKSEETWAFCVADFECSIGVIGTGFWRAPEILQACKDKNMNHNSGLFTGAVDTYSYGMTSYEILTGRLPFQFHPLGDQRQILTDLVINQHLRPEVPEFVDDWTCDLLYLCWQSDPAARPSFEEILCILEANSNSAYIKQEAVERRKVKKVQNRCS